MKTLSLALFTLVALLFTGCSSKKYFEPKQTFSASNASSNVRSRVRDQPKEDIKPTVRKDYEAERDKIKKDREQFLKKKGIGGNNSSKAPEQTLKPAKWGKSRSKSREVPN